MENLFIMGNGFDLNIGYKTSYSDFMASKQFLTLIFKGNKLCIYLKEQEDIYSWIDIEAKLASYSLGYNPIDKNRKPFRLEYFALKFALNDYISSIKLSSCEQISYLTRVFTNPHYDYSAYDTVVLDFNYTGSARYFAEALQPYDAHNCQIVNVHGLAKDNNIIFGVQENAKINPEDVWLLKIADKQHPKVNISDYLSKAKNIFFLGFSLGESDHPYFYDFFRQYTYSKSKPKQQIFFTFYKEEGRLGLIKQISALTNKHFSKFEKTFNAKFIDIEEMERLETQKNSN